MKSSLTFKDKQKNIKKNSNNLQEKSKSYNL